MWMSCGGSSAEAVGDDASGMLCFLSAAQVFGCAKDLAADIGTCYVTRHRPDTRCEVRGPCDVVVCMSGVCVCILHASPLAVWSSACLPLGACRS